MDILIPISSFLSVFNLDNAKAKEDIRAPIQFIDLIRCFSEDTLVCVTDNGTPLTFFEALGCQDRFVHAVGMSTTENYIRIELCLPPNLLH